MPEGQWMMQRTVRETRQSKEATVAVAAAGFAVLFALHKLAKAVSARSCWKRRCDVAAPGGTGTAYPGALLRHQDHDYGYHFIPNSARLGNGRRKYASPPEILRYFGFVRRRNDLRRDIRFGTKVEESESGERKGRGREALASCDSPAAIVMGIASKHGYGLSLTRPKPAEIDGVQDFKGNVLFHRALAPQEGVDLNGRNSESACDRAPAPRIVVPLIAEHAPALTVFSDRRELCAAGGHNGPSARRQQQDLFGKARAPIGERRRAGRWPEVPFRRRGWR